MQIPLPNPVSVIETIVQESQRSTVDIDFAYADFATGKVTLKIQPWNHEIVISGEDYQNMRAQFEAALATAFAPAVTAFLESIAPDPEEGQPEEQE
ncbi:MAG: hypothetical protein ACOVMP_00525 [Chthoniobacterales bacterium]